MFCHDIKIVYKICINQKSALFSFLSLLVMTSNPLYSKSVCMGSLLFVVLGKTLECSELVWCHPFTLDSIYYDPVFYQKVSDSQTFHDNYHFVKRRLGKCWGSPLTGKDTQDTLH